MFSGRLLRGAMQLPRGKWSEHRDQTEGGPSDAPGEWNAATTGEVEDRAKYYRTYRACTEANDRAYRVGDAEHVRRYALAENRGMCRGVGNRGEVIQTS